jgi:PleD family two-component response regulator
VRRSSEKAKILKESSATPGDTSCAAMTISCGSTLAQEHVRKDLMVKPEHEILVVTDAPALAHDLRSWLSLEGYRVTVAGSYATAKIRLEKQPSMAITALRLGEYNGLQLAVRARTNRVPVLVVGDRDGLVKREAEQLGATYLAVDELDRDRLITRVKSQLSHSVPPVPGAPASLSAYARPRLG